MSGAKAPMSERFEAVASLVGGYGYHVLHQTGGEDGRDWEVTFHIGSLLTGQQSAIHHCAAPTEDALLEWLARWLPFQAAKEWRQYAFALEAMVARR